MTKLTSMRNIGKEMEKKLKSVGISSAEELLRAAISPVISIYVTCHVA